MTFNFPQVRMRRRRLSENIRILSRENTLNVENLILPVFIIEGENKVEDVASMPLVQRYSIDRLLKVCEKAQNLGIPAIALFPVTPIEKKNHTGSEAHNPNNLVCKALSKIKKEFPELLLIADVALDPYTTHGQDGLIDENNRVQNDPTIDVLVEQSILQAQAGADIIAPSDMMDGRIGAIRTQLDRTGLHNTLICSYCAKYASAFYGPFRDAVGSKGNLGKGNKKNYQMDFANSREALLEADLDVSEGADFLMVKPGMPYLDIINKLYQRHNLPVFAYQVSGEYSSIYAAGINGWLDTKDVMMESLMCFRRAGAQAILTYYALEAALILKNS